MGKYIDPVGDTAEKVAPDFVTGALGLLVFAIVGMISIAVVVVGAIVGVVWLLVK